MSGSGARLEFEFGHRLTKGRHNRAVHRWFLAHGLPEIARAMAQAGLLEDAPASAKSATASALHDLLKLYAKRGQWGVLSPARRLVGPAEGRAYEPFDRSWRFPPRGAAFANVVGRLVSAAGRDIADAGEHWPASAPARMAGTCSFAERASLSSFSVAGADAWSSR